jgi:hypothetical protein
VFDAVIDTVKAVNIVAVRRNINENGRALMESIFFQVINDTIDFYLASAWHEAIIHTVDDFINPTRGINFPRSWDDQQKQYYLSQADQDLARIMEHIHQVHGITDPQIDFDKHQRAMFEFRFLTDSALAVHLTLEERVEVLRIFEDSNHILKPVRDYLRDVELTDISTTWMTMTVRNTYAASDQGYEHDEWFAFMVGLSIFDGAARLGYAVPQMASYIRGYSEYKTINNALAAQQGSTNMKPLSPSEAAEIISGAPRTSTAAIHTDTFHRAPGYLPKSYLESGQTSIMQNQRDGVQRTLLVVPGEVNGIRGVFEFIIEPSGAVSHQLFKPIR